MASKSPSHETPAVQPAAADQPPASDFLTHIADALEIINNHLGTRADLTELIAKLRAA